MPKEDFGNQGQRHDALEIAADSWEPIVDEYIRFDREALPRPMLEAVRAKFGAEDAPEAWRLVADAVQPQVRADGSLALPSVALCARAVAPGG